MDGITVEMRSNVGATWVVNGSNEEQEEEWQ